MVGYCVVCVCVCVCDATAISVCITPGTAVYPEYGTTNLHLDISDAVNVMVSPSVTHINNDYMY